MSEATLLLRLAAPTQAWNGRRTRWQRGFHASSSAVNAAQLAPTHSGVVGLMACALGRPRGTDMDDLAALDIVVRTDQLGEARREFRTAQRPNSSGKMMTVPEQEWVLDDAAFLVGVGGDPDLLTSVAWALGHPHWHCYLGKKEYPPTLPLTLGALVDGDADTAVRAHEWIASDWYRRRQPRTVSLTMRRPIRMPDRYWHDDKPTPRKLRLPRVLMDNPIGTRTSIS